MNSTLRYRNGSRWLQAIVVAFVAASAAHAELGNTQYIGWKTEPGVERPSFAAVEPTTTNINVNTVVLACEQAQKSRVLQLQLYLSDDGPLRPIGMSPEVLTNDPKAKILIDTLEFPAALLFAGDHTVLADSQEGRFPSLSDQLLDALQWGQTLILHFDLVARKSGRPTSFDGKVTIDLRAPDAREAIAAMRRCAGAPSA